jgi:hypothetical protein
MGRCKVNVRKERLSPSSWSFYLKKKKTAKKESNTEERRRKTKQRW